MPRTGLEPAHLAAHVPETCVSTIPPSGLAGANIRVFGEKTTIFQKKQRRMQDGRENGWNKDKVSNSVDLRLFFQ